MQIESCHLHQKEAGLELIKASATHEKLAIFWGSCYNFHMEIT